MQYPFVTLMVVYTISWGEKDEIDRTKGRRTGLADDRRNGGKRALQSRHGALRRRPSLRYNPAVLAPPAKASRPDMRSRGARNSAEPSRLRQACSTSGQQGDGGVEEKAVTREVFSDHQPGAGEGGGMEAGGDRAGSLGQTRQKKNSNNRGDTQGNACRRGDRIPQGQPDTR